MSEEDPATVTILLRRLRSGDEAVHEKLAEIVYAELARRARLRLRAEPRHLSLIEPASLVHEAYVRLMDQKATDWKDRAHFFAIATQLMRRILIDRARRRAARGRNRPALPIDDDASLMDGRELAEGAKLDVLQLDLAMTRLEEVNPKAAEVWRLRFFGDMQMTEIAEVMSLSRQMVDRYWRAGRAWFIKELQLHDTPR